MEPARGLGHLPSSRAPGAGQRGRLHRRPGRHRFHVSHTQQEWQAGGVEYNFRTMDFRPPAGQDNPFIATLTSAVGTDWETYRREGPGMSAFALDGGVVYHTYSAYERGIDILWGMYPWLDRAPLGRNETGPWWRRHDEYNSQ
jgi:predicted dithiol-disulfide oxidoreductase (DUF899 family)